MGRADLKLLDYRNPYKDTVAALEYSSMPYITVPYTSKSRRGTELGGGQLGMEIHMDPFHRLPFSIATCDSPKELPNTRLASAA